MNRKILFFIFFSSFAFGQFTVSDSSKDWVLLGREQSETSILINSDKAKLKMIDIRSKTVGFDPLSTFKSKSQQNADKLRGEVRKGNDGVKDGYYEFIFKIEPDTLDKIYEIIKSHFDSKTKELLTLSFPEGNLYLDFNSKTAFYAVSFGIDVNDQKIFSMPLLKSNINKIFGKK